MESEEVSGFTIPVGYYQFHRDELFNYHLAPIDRYTLRTTTILTHFANIAGIELGDHYGTSALQPCIASRSQ